MKNTLTLTVVMLTFLFNSSISSAAGLKDLIDENLRIVKEECTLTQGSPKEIFNLNFRKDENFKQIFYVINGIRPDDLYRFSRLLNEIALLESVRNSFYNNSFEIISQNIDDKVKSRINQKRTEISQKYCQKKQNIYDLESLANLEKEYESKQHQTLLDTIPLIENRSPANAAIVEVFLKGADKLYDQLLLQKKEYRKFIEETIRMQS